MIRFKQKNPILLTPNKQIKAFWQQFSFGTPLILNTYPGAAAAYSIRQLNNTYAGSLIRVRRLSDNNELDIGYDSNGDLDTTTLNSFCSGTDGFVSIWYDQSGNSKNATQLTAINQPKIYDSSAGILLLNGIPALDFDGSNDRLDLPNFNTLGDTTILSIIGDLTFSPSNPRFYDIYDGTNHIQFIVDGGSTHKVKYDLWQGGISATDHGAASTSHQLNFLFVENGSNTLYNNNLTTSATSSTNVGSAGSVGKIGARADTNAVTFLNGKFQELIIYQSDQLSNRIGLQNNINSYYTIY